MLACGTLQCVVHSKMHNAGTISIPASTAASAGVDVGVHCGVQMILLGLALAACSDSEECVYWCGKHCANNDESVGDALKCVRSARRKGLSEHDRCRPDAAAREYFRCVDDCHVSSDATEACAEAANERCHVNEYGAPELDALKAQCAELVGIRDGCLGTDEEYVYNVTAAAVERMPKLTSTETPERRRLARLLKRDASPETGRLDELIFLLDLYCWGGHGCDPFETHRDEYEAFLAKYGPNPLRKAEL